MFYVLRRATSRGGLSGTRHQQSSEGMGSSPAAAQKPVLHWQPHKCLYSRHIRAVLRTENRYSTVPYARRGNGPIFTRAQRADFFLEFYNSVSITKQSARASLLGMCPSIPTKVRVSRLKDGERAAVEVGHIVVDPLLPKLIVSTEVRRQPLHLHRVQEARSADLGV
eukprot:scaffold4127_cov124-Isochrysis_galbana.AAC.6